METGILPHGLCFKKAFFAFKCAIELKFILTLSRNHVSILNICFRYITTANLSETLHYNLSHNLICISLEMYLHIVLMQPATTVIGPFITLLTSKYFWRSGNFCICTVIRARLGKPWCLHKRT